MHVLLDKLLRRIYKAEQDALRSKLRQLKDLVLLGCLFYSKEEAGKDDMKIDHEMEASIIGNFQHSNCRPQEMSWWTAGI